MSQEAEEIFDRQYECEWDKLKKLEIDITNPTGLPQFINLFAFSLQDVAVQYPSLQFTDPTSYNILVQDLEYSPIKARKILFASTSQGQLANPATVQRKYADGISDAYTEFPIISVDTHQRQGNRVEVVFDELILDGFTSFSNYRINAGDTVTVLLYYRQLKRWCIVDFPELFPERQKIAPKIKEKIVEEFCEREENAREQDQDWKCKEGQKQFQVSITNNSATQKFINLFDNYSLTPAEELTVPINTLLTVAGNFSAFHFIEWASGNKKGYTIGGGALDTVVAYDQFGAFTNEVVIGSSKDFTLDQIRGKMYASVGSGVEEYDLGTGNAPTSYPLGIPSVGRLIIDQTNGYLFVTRAGASNVVRMELGNLTNTTTFPTTIAFDSRAGTFSPATNEVIGQMGSDIIGINALTGALSTKLTLGIGEAVLYMEYIEEWNAIAFTTVSGTGYTLYVYSTAFSLIGSYFSAVDTWVGFAFDNDRQQLILPVSSGTIRTLFFTLPSIGNSTFDSFFSNGVTQNTAGYLRSTQTILLGSIGTASIQTLDRSPTIEFDRPESYDFFTESLGEEPVKVSCLDVIANTQEQLVNNLVIQTKDADGHVHSRPKSPIVRVDTYQDQAGRSFLEMDEGLILDANTTFASYPLNAGETVTMVYYYHQFKRASLLSEDNPKRVKIQMPEPIIDYGELDKEINHDKYLCQKECKTIEIKVTNASGADAPFNFFLANQNTLIVNQLNATFDNVEDYNFLVQQLRDSPLVLCGVEVIGSSQDQLTEPVIVATIDADGNDFAYQHFPINYVDTNQKDGTRVFVKTNHLLLDGYTLWPLYNIKAGTSITFVLYYRQFLRSDFLKTHYYPILRRPIVKNGSQITEDIEYYNDLTHFADNTWDFEGNAKKPIRNMAEKSEKSVIFGAEQVYSDGFTANRSDFLVPFFKKVRVKYKETRANCEIPKPDKQILYVNPNDLSFGKETDFPVEDISDQGYGQFKDDGLGVKPIGERDMIDLSQQQDQEGIGRRGWSYRKAKEHYTRNGGEDFVLKERIKPTG